jgi:hypothetical protein
LAAAGISTATHAAAQGQFSLELQISHAFRVLILLLRKKLFELNFLICCGMRKAELL